MEGQTESPTLELATMDQITDELHERHDAFVMAWVSGEGHHFQSNISIEQATCLYLNLATKVAEEQDIPLIGIIPVTTVITRRKRERAAYIAVALLTIIAVLEFIIILSLLAERHV